ncbi:MAG: glycosyltransferase family 4 protein [Planctomycetes bacterium]|nr:glycosyltransferase family 4 protein [Planctomycetota bacterium]
MNTAAATPPPQAPAAAPTRRLRVLEFIRPTTGGAARHVELLVRMIDRRRFDVSVVTADEGRSPFVERLVDLGTEVTRLEIKRAFHPVSDAIALWRIYRLLRRGRFHLVHCHAAKAGMLGRIAARLAGTPAVVYTAHGFYFNYGLPWIKRLLHIGLERLLGRVTTRIVATAPREGAQIVELQLTAPERVSIIPNAVDTNRFRPPAAPPPTGPARVVGMVSRLAPPKDPFTFLAAARLVLARFPATRFVLVGDGPLLPPARRYARELGIAASVDFLGYREDIQTEIASFDVNVLSSLWEGLPYALVEGMALGKVAVGPDISGCADLIRDGENGFLFPRRDAEMLARHVMRLLGDDALRQAMGRAARAFVVEHHSADRWIKRIEGLYLLAAAPGECAAVFRATAAPAPPPRGP